MLSKLEREKYSPEGLSKFGQFMDVAYENPGVTIHRALEPGTQLVRLP